MKGPNLEQLLRYERHLEGETFTRNVLAIAARRRHRRAWILLGALGLATAATVAIKPDKFTFISNLHLPLQDVSASVATLPAGGLLAMLLVSILIIGISKTVNSI